MKSKKAVSLSMNTIIIATLAIVVLVVLIYLLVGHTKETDKATSCSRKAGICMDQCPETGIYTKSLGGDLCDNGQECCVPGT